MSSTNGSHSLAGDKPNGSAPPLLDLGLRVAALEEDMKDVKAMLLRLEPAIIRIDERTNHMATKADVQQVRSDVMIELASKAGRGTVWTAGLTMVALVLAAAALGAVYMPYVATLFRRSGL